MQTTANVERLAPLAVDANPTKLLYRRREAAEVLSVSAGTVDNLVKRGQLRPVYVGKLPMFSRMELERFCRELEQRNAESEKNRRSPLD